MNKQFVKTLQTLILVILSTTACQIHLSLYLVEQKFRAVTQRVAFSTTFCKD